MKTFLFALLTVLLSEANGAVAPFIKPCKYDDNACMLASSKAAMPFIVAGIPALGVNSVDPLFIKEVNGDQGDLKLTFRDLVLHGLSKCTFIKALRDAKKSSFTLDVECPIMATGKYSLGGKILFIPAEGEGDIEIKTDKAKIVLIAKYKTIKGKDGNEHWKITGYDYTYELLEKVLFKLDNLFGGDETRAKPIRDLLDQSWKELITELGAPIIKELVKLAIDPIDHFFSKVPINELQIQ